MRNLFGRIRNSKKESNIDNSYVEVPQSDISEGQSAIKLCTDLQRDYVKCFKERGKKNLKL